MTAQPYNYRDAILTLSNVSMSFHGEPVLRDINAQILDVTRPGMSQGQVVGFYGRSGIGKSVLCRIMAGLMVPSSGSVEVGLAQQPVEPGMVGFVQQRYPLFDHRTLFDNLLVAAARKYAPAEARQHVEAYLERFCLVPHRRTASTRPTFRAGSASGRPLPSSCSAPTTSFCSMSPSPASTWR
ncbi:ATP-binding cassette domain-containing protein [Hymenobacter terrenus]|uniref:ATP-binding cassette domain-containing protein n=1 Tax=Hymenobacter terrenus TaxID=1629124 RepID=UPI00061A01B5|nr:ATP-binding cassette domain-containing protein [Hymenobacter terrenus]